MGATSRLRAFVATSGTPVADSAESCTLGGPRSSAGRRGGKVDNVLPGERTPPSVINLALSREYFSGRTRSGCSERYASYYPRSFLATETRLKYRLVREIFAPMEST